MDSKNLHMEEVGAVYKKDVEGVSAANDTLERLVLT